MKETRKLKKKNSVKIPSRLKQKIESLQLTKIYKSHSLKMIHLLLNHSFIEHGDIFGYTPKSSNYLEKVFGGRYNDWLKVLIESKIVLRNSIYTDKVCYYYSINPKYFMSEIQIEIDKIYNNYKSKFILSTKGNTILKKYAKCVGNKYKDNLFYLLLSSNILNEPLISVEYDENIKYDSREDYLYLKEFENDIKKLTIDYNQLNKIIDNVVDEISIDGYTINEEITNEKLLIKYMKDGKKCFYKMGRSQALQKAKDKCLDLIKVDNHFIIMKADSYIESKKMAVFFAYHLSLESLIKEAYRAKRNTTNYRLDTNLTNMGSEIVDDICKQNNLVQIDLKNSQFAILSLVLNRYIDTEDFELFALLSGRGWLYEYIAKELSLESRKRGKLSMFEIMFGKRKSDSLMKQRVTELFPSVVEWIDNYKKKYGDDKFSVMLQNEESKIFIDNIYKAIKMQKMFCLTKHDSVIVEGKDKEAVLKILDDYFLQIGLQNSLDIKSQNV